MQSPENMTKDEVAKYLRVSRATVTRLMNEGLPHIKLSRRVLFRKADVDHWLGTKTVKK